MAKTQLVGFLLCLMAWRTLQDQGNDIDQIKANTTGGFNPKSFKGNPCETNCTSQRGSFSFPPELGVDPWDAAAAYTQGAVSSWVIPSCYVLAMAVGIPSNVYILAFLRVKARTFTPALLYLSLALSDTLLLASLALRVHYHLSGDGWVFGEAACRLVTALFYGNIYCSAHTIACIVLKRYLAVVRPFLYRRLPRRGLTLVACLGVWLLFAAAVVPELAVRQSYVVPRLGVVSCHDVLPLGAGSHAWLVPYRLALVWVGFVAPFAVCVCTHAAMIYHLGRSFRDWAPFIRVSSLVLLIFTACFLPSGALHLAHYTRLLSGGGDGLYGHYRLAVCLCCFHSCLDPFLCVLMSKTPASRLKFSTGRVSLRRPAVIT
ncbi:proteinase-activated receptor 3 [Gadus macrocephalus]|uniref:proteinase-activated receptor 3 n=1 Tax=Gadus macrocephalus TaxID=80720 RepID=UPI0028CB4321|nr:proteinase-activated receptor 3 [Gadus macrocephalus]